MKSEWRHAVNQLRRSLAPEFPIQDSNDDHNSDDGVATENEAEELAEEISLVRSELRPPLFDYQRELIDLVLETKHAHNLLALPTGAGKTRTAAVSVLSGMSHGLFERVIWLAPSLELLDQATDAFRQMWMFHGSIERLRLSRSLVPLADVPVVALATPQTVYARRADLTTRYERLPWDLVVFDEAHQLGAPTFRRAIETLGIDQLESRSGAGSTRILGLSATPGRVDPDETEDLVSLFRGHMLRSALLEPSPVETLQRRGVLSELKFRRLTRTMIASENEGRRLLVGARACVELVRRSRRLLVFAASVPGAIVLAEALSAKGLRAAAVHSGMANSRRKSMIADFSGGDLDVLVNQRLLATGYDCPAVSDLLILGRIGSPILFEQMVGRAARGPRTGGSKISTIWDFDDHLSIHGRPSSYYRYREYDWRHVAESDSP